MVDWVLLGVAFIVSASLTLIVRHLALQNRLLDVPVHRSAHTSPKPTTGGFGFVLVFYLGLGYYYLEGAIPAREAMVVLAGLAVAVLGLIDDLKHLTIPWRVAVQLLATLWALWWLGDIPSVLVFDWEFHVPGLIHLLALLSLLWLLNLFNFMDGIDGLAAGEAGFVSLVVFFLVIDSSDQSVALLSALLCSVVAGFLLFNWPPAKIFMGDVGSNFLGLVLGLLAIISMLHGSMNVWTWILLLGVFVVDATYTLVYRMFSGFKWYFGHDTHAYQHAARRFGSHGRVTLAVLLINLIWLTPLAWLAQNNPQYGVMIALVGLLPLVLLARHLDAGKAPAGTL